MNSLSKMIRDKKKNALRPDMDSAGQIASDPNAAWDAKMDSQVDDVLGDPDHEPPSAREMGEGEGTQELEQRKRWSKRLEKYFDSL